MTECSPCRAVWGGSGRRTRTDTRLVPQCAHPHVWRVLMSGETPYHSMGWHVNFAVVSSRTLTERCRSCCHLSSSSVPVLRRQGGIGASALRGSNHMEGVRTWKSGSRLSATLGERTSTIRLCTLAETPPTGHGRCARRQHISRLQKKEQEDGKQRGGSAHGTTRADGTLRRGF